MEIGHLSLEEAISISALNPATDEFDDCIDLSSYAQAELKAFEFLASQGHRQFVILGLTNLDVQLASVITSFFHSITFTNLVQLSRESASILSNTMNVLEIEGLGDMEAEVASELAKHKFALYLSFLGTLTSNVVQELAKHNHELFLTVAIEPHMDVQKAILFTYVGYEVTLRFPVDNEICRSDYYEYPNKKIEIRSFQDDSGRLWRDITANDVDGWFSRNETNKADNCDVPN